MCIDVHQHRGYAWCTFMLVCIAAVSLLGAAGCGDGDDGSDGTTADAAVVDTVDGYLTAMREGDVKAACGYLLPPSARKASPVSECVAEMRKEDELGKLEQQTPDLSFVKIDGDRATVRFQGSSKPLGLVEEDGRWYLTALTEAR